MNIARHIAATLLGTAFAFAASAQEATPDHWMSVTSSKTRAQVSEELQLARKDGSIRATDIGYNFTSGDMSLKMREQVRAELMAAKQSGEFQALNAEAHGFYTTRTPVYAKGQ